MINPVRALAAVAAGALVLTALAAPAVGAKPRPVRPASAALTTGCVTTVTDTAPNWGWFWRTTQTVCNTPDNQSDCISVENVPVTYGPANVTVLPTTCRYGRLR